MAADAATQRMVDLISQRQTEAGKRLARAYGGSGGQFSLSAREAEREVRRAHDPKSYR
jgi:hypothetical protein